MGIHGEPGHQVIAWEDVSQLVPRLLRQILAYRAAGPSSSSAPDKPAYAAPGSRVALMVNNLGATPLMELLLAAKEALDFLRGNEAQARAIGG